MSLEFNFYLMVLRERTCIGDRLESLLLVYNKHGGGELKDALDWIENKETKLLLVKTFNASLKPGQRLLSVDPPDSEGGYLEGFFLSSIVLCQYEGLGEVLRQRLDQGLGDEHYIRILSPWTIRDAEVEGIFRKLTDSLMHRSGFPYVKPISRQESLFPLAYFT